MTSETISMSISVYLLLGFTWTTLYVVISILQPGAFSIAGLAAPIPRHLADPQPMFPILGYFSLITLSTVGYGDITPMTLQARFAAAAGITGQFYLAILVARLVGMQMSQASGQSVDQALNSNPEPESKRIDDLKIRPPRPLVESGFGRGCQLGPQLVNRFMEQVPPMLPK